MSKAKDLAKELYPDWEVTGVPKIDGQEESMVRIQRVAYITGYHQAEKDLELSWKDIADILDVTDVIANDDSMEERLKTMSEKEYCQEVLKRFKDLNMFSKIKEIIFKVKDYDRLESDYCTVLDMMTGGILSKPNYTMDSVREAFNAFLDQHDKEVYKPAETVEKILNRI